MNVLRQPRVLTGAVLILSALCWMTGLALAESSPEAPPAGDAPAAAAEGAAAAEAPAPAPPPKVDTGDTAWMLTSTALVLLMTAPGLAFFYSGMVREKNALGTLMQSFIVLCVVSVQWVLFGYTLAFGPDQGHVCLLYTSPSPRD